MRRVIGIDVHPTFGEVVFWEIHDGLRESAQSWRELLLDLKRWVSHDH
jgi:hypothetical protein